MDLKQLRSFVNIAELGSISLAAERLHVAQPALTRQIQALESEIEVRLFERNGRGVSLTPQGKTLLARAIMILEEVEHARAEMKSEQLTLTGTASLGVPASLSCVFAGPLIQKFAEQYPQVHLRILSAHSGQLLDLLKQGVIDLGVLYGASESSTLRVRPLLVEQLYLIERAGSSNASVASLAEVASHPLILPTRQHGITTPLAEVMESNGIEMVPVVEVDSLPLQLDLVMRGLGSAVQPLSAVLPYMDSDLFSARLIVAPEIPLRLMLASSVDNPTAAATRRLADMIIGEVDEAVRSGRWSGLRPVEFELLA
jgi:DNA-binding transcriptional LysR family regulator